MPDYDLLEKVKFPPIMTLDTSNTPKAGDARIAAPILATADIAKITKQIQAIQTTLVEGKPKRPAKQVNGPLAPQAPAVKAATTQRMKPGKKSAPPLSAATPEQVATAITAARTAAGLSRGQLGALLKMATPNIVRLEKGRSLPSTRTLQRIAKATGHVLQIVFARP